MHHSPLVSRVIKKKKKMRMEAIREALVQNIRILGPEDRTPLASLAP
jgi:hypothetical protein